MNQQALEAAATCLFWDDYEEGIANGISWETCANKEKYLERARAALTAYAEACGERVVATNQTGQHVSVTIPELDARFWVFIGESIVLERKVGG